ncbi:MAG: hypothetical protein NT075_20855 [Chloroflexi bacterium]|nr:hypothetical protein [Chloroflexota bacterium]
MNSIAQNYLPMFREYQVIREQLMAVLTDSDLAFSLGGETLTLAALCREIGEIEAAYSQAFKTFKLDFTYRNTSLPLEASVAALTAWYVELDHALETTITALTEDEIATKSIDRGDGWQQPVPNCLDIYKEALIIFYGKASIYLRALGKPRPQQMQAWIG